MVTTPQWQAVGVYIIRVTIWRRGVVINYEAKFGEYNQFTQYRVGKKTDGNKQFILKGLAVASIARDDPSTLIPGDDPFPHARMHRVPACTAATAMRGKLRSEFET